MISNKGSAALSNKASKQKTTGAGGKFGHLTQEVSEVVLTAQMPREQFLEMARSTDQQLDQLRFKAMNAQMAIKSYADSARRYKHHPQTEAHYLEMARKETAALEAANAAMDPLHELYEEHQWSRFIAVPGGHMHSGYDCHTIRWNTATSLMAEFSGADEEELVDMAGDFCCTHCFPDAPVHKRSMLPMHVKEREDAAKKTAELDEKKAAKLKKAADPTSPDGVFTVMEGKWRQHYKTITSMVNRARDHLGNTMSYGFDNEYFTAEQLEQKRRGDLALAWPLVLQAATRNKENGEKLDTPRKLITDLWTKKNKQYTKEGYGAPEGYDPFTELPEEAVGLLDG